MHVLESGYCWASEHHIRRGASRRRIKCHALVALFEHPREGWILFDTGYAPRFIEATRSFPASIYRHLVPVEISAESTVVRQLARFGLTAADVRHVILSHFHADHVAGLHDFPEAQIICARNAYDHFRQLRGIRALIKAYVSELVPTDLPDRAHWITDFADAPVPGLGATHDLFGDGRIRIVSLPGHARGQVGAIVTLGDETVFLAADGCWQRESYRRLQPPHWITHGFVDDAAAMRRTLDEIGKYHRACPDVVIVPTHCPESHADLVRPFKGC